MTDRRDSEKRGPFSRRDFLKTGAAAAATLLLPGVHVFGAERRRRPNVLVFFTDDQADIAIGYASKGAVKTPNLDRLARRGVTFSNAYCSAITCVPSRSTFYSGCYYHRCDKIADFGAVPLRPGAWTWARALRQQGYRTGLMGKGHFTPKFARHGFDVFECSEGGGGEGPAAFAPGDPQQTEYVRWVSSQVDFKEPRGTQVWPYDTKYHRISWIRDRSIDFMQDCQELNQPFALAVTFPYPHAPYTPSKEFLDQYDPSTIPLPTERWTDLQDMPAELKNPQIYAGNNDAYAMPKDKYQYYLACYRALCTQMDDAIGKMLKHIDLDNTLVIYTSDHGDYQGRRGRTSKIPWMGFDATAQVPMLMAGAGVPRGRTAERPVQIVDLAPTMLQAAGAPIPDGLDGIPLQPYFDNPNPAPDRVINCHGVAYYQMIRWQDLKYYCLGKGKGEMLFDMSTDPGEWKNLANVPARQNDLTMMRAKWEALMARPKAELPQI